MRRCLPMLLVPALLALSGCGLFRDPPPEGAEIRVETVPAGALIVCNGGTPRISPATFDGLTPGVHVLDARKDGYRHLRQTLSLMAGQKTTVSLRLDPLLGLVLLHSTPPGAEVTVDGAFRGRTPLLIPDFPLGTHRVRMAMPGYEEKEIELTVQDRTPIKTSVDLTSKTARLTIDSDPTGAAVFIDQAPRGATPCEVEAPAGVESRIELKLDGYASFTETLTLQAGGTYPIRARLMPLPAELHVASTPPGARVLLDGEFRGVTPAILSDVGRGEHRLRLELKGYETLDRVLTVTAAGPIREEAALVRNSGTLVLITEPAGAEVFVDGEPMGVTAESPAGGAASEPLRIDLLARGPHTLQLTRRGYAFTPKPFTIEPDQVVQLQETLTRLFIRDTVVAVRKDTSQYEVTGQLLRRLPNGDVELEVNPGIIQKIEASAISELRPLKSEHP